jgi:hypothetical protein
VGVDGVSVYKHGCLGWNAVLSVGVDGGGGVCEAEDDDDDGAPAEDFVH